MARNSYWQRFQRERISRRRALGTVGLGAAGLAVAAACGGGGEEETGGEPTPSSEGTPKAGGTYKGITTVAWGTLDPLVSVGGAPGIFARLYNSLLDRSRTNPDFWFQDLSLDFEQPDETTTVFNIRPGVKIAPNDLDIPERDMDALDAEAWMKRIDEDETAIARSFTDLWVAGHSAPDAQTFIINTVGPYAYFFFRLGPPLGGTMPPKEFFEKDIDLRGPGVGAGPYVVRPGSYEDTGGIIMERNVNYYRTDPDNNDAQLPYNHVIDVARIDDRLTRSAAFQSGQIYNYGAEKLEEAEQLERDVPGSYKTETPTNNFISFTMNPTRPPWDNELIRKAALHALNRRQMIDIIVGPDGGKPNGLVHWPTGSFAFDEDELEQYQKFDPQMSKDLIKQATGEDTIKVKIIYPTGLDVQFIAETVPIFFQQMKEAGFEVEQEAIEFTEWLTKYTDVDYEASLSPNQTYETAETVLDWQHSMGPAGNGDFNIGIGQLYPEIDKAVEDSKATTDPDEHIQRVRDAQILAYEKGPGFLPLFSWINYTMYQPFVKNIPRGLGGAGQYLNTQWLDLDL